MGEAQREGIRVLSVVVARGGRDRRRDARHHWTARKRSPVSGGRGSRGFVEGRVSGVVAGGLAGKE
jgi:hypothetical protein